MTEGPSDIQINQLIKRIDDQARFTRTLVVVCTASIMGVFFYLLTELYGHFPVFTFNYFLENLDKIHGEWNGLDLIRERAMKEAPGTQPAAQAEAGKK